MKHVEFGSKIAVIPGYFDIVHYSNSGAAFGILSGADAGWRTPFFYIVSVLALVFIGVYIYKLKPGERAMAFALSLVVGGIFGNSLDRIRFGSVTDFLSAHVGDKVLLGIQLEWPAFNVADSAITVAMALLILQALSRKP
jgi:signal peptidase II